MKTWEELVNEVQEVGFEKASAAARLAWACETVNGIDQHAAPDLKELFGEIERLQQERREIANSIRLPPIDGEAPDNLAAHVELLMLQEYYPMIEKIERLTKG